jgi:Integrase core domain
MASSPCLVRHRRLRSGSHRLVGHDCRISGEIVRDLTIVCVDLVEWLSDNGSACIAKDTLDTATALGQQLCFTPVRSPESNGIAEAFVKTFKRDYARWSILPDAATVIALPPALFEDYNEVHPHSPLPKRISSPQCLAQPSCLSGQTGAHHCAANTLFPDLAGAELRSLRSAAAASRALARSFWLRLETADALPQARREQALS